MTLNHSLTLYISSVKLTYKAFELGCGRKTEVSSAEFSKFNTFDNLSKFVKVKQKYMYPNLIPEEYMHQQLSRLKACHQPQDIV